MRLSRFSYRDICSSSAVSDFSPNPGALRSFPAAIAVFSCSMLLMPSTSFSVLIFFTVRPGISESSRTPDVSPRAIARARRLAVNKTSIRRPAIAHAFDFSLRFCRLVPESLYLPRSAWAAFGTRGSVLSPAFAEQRPFPGARRHANLSIPPVDHLFSFCRTPIQYIKMKPVSPQVPRHEAAQRNPINDIALSIKDTYRHLRQTGPIGGTLCGTS